jgi:diguanylate cyclase (GGDEF)-like protein
MIQGGTGMQGKSRILIAEDETSGAQYLQQTLIRLGYEVADIVQAGEEVIDRVEDIQPNLILMDISLKGQMDGITTAKQVHSKFDIPVIFLTGHTDDTFFERAKITGPYGYLIKPYELSQLRHAIELALSKHLLVSELKHAEREISELNAELKKVNINLMKEIAERKKIEKQLRHQAHHDPLTGLPNRLLLFELLKQSFAFEDRHNSMLALMMLDLDNFKFVNDSMGHMAGDILLKKVGKRLQQCMRQYDMVGRLGGDEFVIVANDINTVQDIIRFAEKITGLFQSPFEILGKPTYITTSIGVAVYPLHGSNAETLLKMADLAMYSAKKDGKNAFRFFSESMDTGPKAGTARRTKKNTALEREKLLRRSVPVIDVTTDKDRTPKTDKDRTTH